ncbi:MAG: cation-translocating P-type ATPase, partial [Verrucomicrobiota bacterium]
NMRKTVSFLLCSSSAEILILMTALVLGLPLPLLALMILWINLVIDGAITIPLIMEPKEDVMNRPPDKKDASIVTKEMLKILFFRVPIMAAVVLGIYVYKLSGGHSLEYIRTVAFTTLFVAQWASGMSSRSNTMSVFKGFFRNKYIIGSFVVGFALHLTVLYMPFLQKVFGTVPLTLFDWLQITFVGSLVLVAEEIKKFIFARKRPR